MAEFKYKRDESVNHIIQESGNKFVALRKISWNDKDAKIDIRNWYNDANGEEIMGKGISLTDEGCDDLTVALLEEGYGNTKEVINSIKNRKEFMVDIKSALNGEDESEDTTVDSDDEEDYYDPTELLG